MDLLGTCSRSVINLLDADSASHAA
jgi:hypothetical protein